MVAPSPKIVINLTRTYEKLHCKGEIYRFSGQQDPSVHTDGYPVTFSLIVLAILLKLKGNDETPGPNAGK